MEEKWVQVKGFASYEISDQGRIRRKANQRVLKHNIYQGGMHRVSLISGLGKAKKVKQVLIHRLVAEAFVGNLGKNTIVIHIDGNKDNNTPENLRIEQAIKSEKTGALKIDVLEEPVVFEKKMLTDEEWENKIEQENETEPNYKALMFCILHNVTADDALRQMGVYDRQRSPSEKSIEDNPYVSCKTRGRQTPDRDRVINL